MEELQEQEVYWFIEERQNVPRNICQMSEDYSTIYRKRRATYDKGWKFRWLTPVPAARPCGAKTVCSPQPRVHSCQFYSDFEKTFVLCSREEKCREQRRIDKSRKKCTQKFIHFMDSCERNAGESVEDSRRCDNPFIKRHLGNSMGNSALGSDLTKKFPTMSSSSGI